MSTHTSLRLKITASLLALGLGLVLSGCGSDDPSDQKAATTDTSERDALVAAAQAVLDEGSERPTQIPVTVPITKPIPSDKTIGFVNCGADVCIELGKALTEANNVLGWETKVINTDGSVEEIANAWKQLADDPEIDGVYGSGYPKEIFAGSLAKLEERGAPVVECCTMDAPGDGITIMQGQSKDYAPLTTLWAAAVTVDSNADGDVLYITNPGFSTQADMTKFFKADLASMCPDCSIEDLEIPLTSIGADSSNRIVSTLRSNSDIKYVVIAYGGVTVGLPAALKAASLNDVKILDQSATLQGYQYIATGQQLATVVYPYRDSMWQAADAFARVFAGEAVDPSNQPPQFWHVHEGNLPSTSEYFQTVDDYKAQYTALWGK